MATGVTTYSTGIGVTSHDTFMGNTVFASSGVPSGTVSYTDHTGVEAAAYDTAPQGTVHYDPSTRTWRNKDGSAWGNPLPGIIQPVQEEKKMSADNAYQVQAILQPTENERDAGDRGQVIVPLTTVVACNEKEALILLGRMIPEEHVKDLNRVSITVLLIQ